MVDSLLGEVRYAVRQFTSAPTFALVAIVTLALGMDANAAIFSVINRLLLRPLPFPQPDRSMFVEGILKQPDREIGFQLGCPDIQHLRTEAQSFAAAAPWATSFGLALDREDGA
jgi:putative ABC transport system permease protein